MNEDELAHMKGEILYISVVQLPWRSEIFFISKKSLQNLTFCPFPYFFCSKTKDSTDHLHKKHASKFPYRKSVSTPVKTSSSEEAIIFSRASFAKTQA